MNRNKEKIYYLGNKQINKKKIYCQKSEVKGRLLNVDIFVNDSKNN